MQYCRPRAYEGAAGTIDDSLPHHHVTPMPFLYPRTLFLELQDQSFCRDRCDLHWDIFLRCHCSGDHALIIFLASVTGLELRTYSSNHTNHTHTTSIYRKPSPHPPASHPLSITPVADIVDAMDYDSLSVIDPELLTDAQARFMSTHVPKSESALESDEETSSTDELPVERQLPQPSSQVQKTGAYLASDDDADAYDGEMNATPGVQNASSCSSEEQVSPLSFREIHSIEATSEGDDDVAEAEVMENGFAHIEPSSGPIRTKPTFRLHHAHSPPTRLSSTKDPQGPLDEDLISRISQILLNNNTQPSDDVYCFCAACGQKFKGNYRHVVERHRHSKRCQVVQDENVEERRGPQLTEDFIVAAFQAALKGTSLNIY